MSNQVAPTQIVHLLVKEGVVKEKEVSIETEKEIVDLYTNIFLDAVSSFIQPQEAFYFF